MKTQLNRLKFIFEKCLFFNPLLTSQSSVAEKGQNLHYTRPLARIFYPFGS